MYVNTGSPQQMADEAVAILESISDGFFSVNADWEIVYLNRRAEILLGVERADVVGKGIRDVFPTLAGSPFEEAYRTAMRDHAPAEIIDYYPQHDKWYEVRVAPTVAGLSFYFRDVSAQLETQHALRDSERNFRLMADSIPQIIWIVTAAGRAIYFNRQWDEYTGVPIASSTPADIANQFVHPDDRDPTMSAWAEASAAHRGFHVEHRILSKTGEYRWFLVRAQPFMNDAGAIERWFGTSTDIHDRKLARIALTESELRFRALANASSDVIYRMSADWKYMHQLDGRGFLKTTSHHDEYRIEEYVHPDDLPLALAAIDKAIRTRTMFALEHRVLRADGGHGWTFSRAVPILDDRGEIREWIGMASDITARKTVEEQLTEESNRKDEFLAMLAHELRNPLAPVKAAAQLLQMGPVSEERVLYTSQIIARQVAHMTNLVDELLDVSRVSKNLIRLDRAPLDMGHVISDAVEQVAPLMQSLSHQLDIEFRTQPIHVDGDKKRLVQIMANLLSNAAKFTPPRGTIRIVADTAGQAAVIDVIDDGIGMTPETASHAFELFSQAERSSDRSSGGLGLGLALVKSLVELHGGTVGCASEGLARGSRFTVRLPLLNAVQGPAETDQQASYAPSRSLRILVVDDNEDAADTLAMLLEAMGHEVAVEHAPGSALDRAPRFLPQVCLLDIGLPGMDGNELAQHLRSRPETERAMLIAVTGYGQESDRARSLTAGFDHHLVKPVDIDKLGLILAQAAR